MRPHWPGALELDVQPFALRARVAVAAARWRRVVAGALLVATLAVGASVALEPTDPGARPEIGYHLYASWCTDRPACAEDPRASLHAFELEQWQLHRTWERRMGAWISAQPWRVPRIAAKLALVLALGAGALRTWRRADAVELHIGEASVHLGGVRVPVADLAGCSVVAQRLVLSRHGAPPLATPTLWAHPDDLQQLASRISQVAQPEPAPEDRRAAQRLLDELRALGHARVAAR